MEFSPFSTNQGIILTPWLCPVHVPIRAILMLVQAPCLSLEDPYQSQRSTHLQTIPIQCQGIPRDVLQPDERTLHVTLSRSWVTWPTEGPDRSKLLLLSRHRYMESGNIPRPVNQKRRAKVKAPLERRPKHGHHKSTKPREMWAEGPLLGAPSNHLWAGSFHCDCPPQGSFEHVIRATRSGLAHLSTHLRSPLHQTLGVRYFVAGFNTCCPGSTST
jgi:hypothetical protein